MKYQTDKEIGQKDLDNFKKW